MGAADASGSVAPAVVGDNVAILDFASLHGETGVVTASLESSAQLEVRIPTLAKTEKIPFANLKKIELGPYDCVEIHSLTSDSGTHLNGQVGVVTRYVLEKDRFEVRIAGVFKNVKADNL